LIFPRRFCKGREGNVRVVKYEIPTSYANLHAWLELMRETLKLPSLYDLAA